MVYGNVLYTFSAMSSKDSTQGCRVANPSSNQDRRYFDVDIGAYRIRFFAKGFAQWDKEYGGDVFRHGDIRWICLRGRAWTLQERELSIRDIHFSQTQVLWECKTTRGSSELPWREARLVDYFKPSPVRNFFGESNDICLLRDRWYALMKDYMSLSLTKSTDKLTALSGFAQAFQKRTPGSQYLIGMWSEQQP